MSEQAQRPRWPATHAAGNAAVPKASVKDVESDSAPSPSDTCSYSESGDESESCFTPIVVDKAAKDARMPKITLSERNCVMDWCSKMRKDKKMNNARWIHNGGAKGTSMTATSGEVRTSGAHEALAK